MTSTRPACRLIGSSAVTTLRLPSPPILQEHARSGIRASRARDDRMTDNRVMPVAAVVFDFFGTLTPSTPEHVWAEHARRSAGPLGIAIPAWRRALDGSFAERVTGVLGDLPATFRELARRCGVEPAEDVLAEACAARLSAQRELFTLRSDALAVL